MWLFNSKKAWSTCDFELNENSDGGEMRESDFFGQ
jgi:hypothetical protein